jgi:DNA invertase Pin-like site-specific DNA recombinase
MNAYGYTRLSQYSDTSIKRQTESIEDYADEHGLDIEAVLDDGQGASGFSSERPEYQRLKQLVQDGGVSAVVIRGTHRLGRDFDERMLFLITLRQAGVELHDTRRGRIYIEDEYVAATEAVVAASDDKPVRDRIKRSREEIQRRIEEGYHHGKPRWGTEYDDAKQHLVIDEDKRGTLETVLSLLDKGVPYRDIEADTGVSLTTISRIKQRAEWYRGKLAEA